jgi:predicted RNA-binding Zn ribbon-like protein
MKFTYQGPVGHEPPAVELHNTLYAIRGDQPIDGLASPDVLSAWLDAISDRLPGPARKIDLDRLPEFSSLRGAVREALHAALEGERPPAGSLEVLNAMAERAPTSPQAVVRADGGLAAETRYHTADATDIALATLAADAIALLGGPRRDDLRACGRPGCVLMLVWRPAPPAASARRARRPDGGLLSTHALRRAARGPQSPLTTPPNRPRRPGTRRDAQRSH